MFQKRLPKGPAIKGDDMPDYKFLLWVYVLKYINQERILPQLWSTPDMSAIVVRTWLEMKLVIKVYAPPVTANPISHSATTL